MTIFVQQNWLVSGCAQSYPQHVKTTHALSPSFPITAKFLTVLF